MDVTHPEARVKTPINRCGTLRCLPKINEIKLECPREIGKKIEKEIHMKLCLQNRKRIAGSSVYLYLSVGGKIICSRNPPFSCLLGMQMQVLPAGEPCLSKPPICPTSHQQAVYSNKHCYHLSDISINIRLFGEVLVG